MLTALVAPETSNLMAPATVLARLKLPESDFDELAEQVAEASGLVARFLGFRPEYTTWRETFSGVSGDRLYLGARPAWSVEGVTYRDGAAQAVGSYLLERGQYGESSIYRAFGTPWGAYDRAWPASGWVESPGIVLSASPVLPDWWVDYTAGWWLEEMEGEPPVGVERFPAELRGDFLRVVRWVRAGEVRDGSVKRMKESDAEVEFFSGKDVEVDPATGIPMACLGALAFYRRAA